MVNPIELKHSKHDVRTKFCMKCRTEYIVNDASLKYHTQCKPYWTYKNKKRYISKSVKHI